MHPEIPRGPEQRERGLNFAAQSEASELHPERNEDAVLAVPESGLFGVFDGMSIPAGGERAASRARDALANELRYFPLTVPRDEAERALAAALQKANQAVQEERQRDRWRSKIGTTASVVFIRRDQEQRRYAAIGSAADSRVWVFHADGVLEQATTDNVSAATPPHRREDTHALQQRLNDVVKEDEMDPLERGMFYFRNAVRHEIGDESFNPVVSSRFLEPSDVILITSDGIHDNLTSKEIATILAKTSNVHESAEALIKAARERSRDEGHLRAKPDDMTAMIVEIQSLRST